MILPPIQNLSTRDDNLIRLINQLNGWRTAINAFTSPTGGSVINNIINNTAFNSYITNLITNASNFNKLLTADVNSDYDLIYTENGDLVEEG